MSEKKKKGVVPRLRFPEFRDAGPWEVKRLGEVCDVLQGYGFPERFQGKQRGQYPFCKVSDITNAVSNTGGHIKEAANYVDEEDIKALRAKPIPKGATIFAKIGEALRLNKRAFVATECLIDNNVVGINARRSRVINYFVFYLSQKIDLNRHCGGAVPSVNKSTLQSIKVIVPHLPEQQKIADCLSSLDKLIELQAQKLDVLRAHKKGLMQQLLPREGETTPRLRFPDFRDAGPWEVKHLGEVASVIKGTQLNRTQLTETGPYPCINGGVKPSGFTDQFNSPSNSITVSEGGNCGYVSFIKSRFWLGGHCYRIEPKTSVDKIFLYQVLKNREPYIKALRVGSALPNIQQKNLAGFAIALPSTIEQQKIADCLSSLDELIELQAQKLDVLKAHKKDLMQQLFPQEVE